MLPHRPCVGGESDSALQRQKRKRLPSTEASSAGGRRVLVWRARFASDSHSSNAAQLLDSGPAYDDREVRVLFTGTISRKLLLGVSLVMGMLLILSFSGISGLYSFRRVIH